MIYTVTTALSEESYVFLVRETERLGLNKQAILEAALHAYKKQQLKEAVTEGLKDSQQEYVDLTEEFREAQNTSIAKYL